MCTDVITHTLRLQKIWLINYLDDYIGISIPKLADSHYQSLLTLLQQVGLPFHENKLEPLSSTITCLGILINAKLGKLSIPEDMLTKI